MSQRNKPKVKDVKSMSAQEIAHLRSLNSKQALAELKGMTPEQISRESSEERVFFKAGDQKGKAMKGGENSMIKIAEDLPGTATFIEYQDRKGRTRTASTVITEDKKLLDGQGNVMRELY